MKSLIPYENTIRLPIGMDCRDWKQDDPWLAELKRAEETAKLELGRK